MAKTYVIIGMISIVLALDLPLAECGLYTDTDLAPAPTPEAMCSNIIYQMSSCSLYFTTDPDCEKPSEECCIGFEDVIQVHINCICEALESSANMGVEFNMTRVWSLPSHCGISPPLDSRICNAVFNVGTNPGNPRKAPKDTLPMHSYSNSDSTIPNVESRESGLSSNILPPPPPATTHSSGANNVPNYNNMFPLSSSVIATFFLFAFNLA